MTCIANIAYSYDRVTRTSRKSRNALTTIGWATRCSCGVLIETKSNSYKSHSAKINKHIEKEGK